MNGHHHRKLTTDMLNFCREEARKRVSLTPYKIIAHRAGVNLSTIENLMNELMKEIRTGKTVERSGIVPRGNEEVPLRRWLTEELRE